MCRERGAEVLEVTLSGFPDKAASAELTLMVGGDERVMARCEPYLRAVGSHTFHAGPVGSGATAKLANNVMFLVARLGIYEALHVARAHGIDEGRMVEIALASSGYSEALRRWRSGGAELAPSSHSFEGIDRDEARHLADALAVARAGGLDLPLVAALLDRGGEVFQRASIE
jgi:3-hydroxyisobutyrate dehydrogenase-like beta-hydroxyacid dehydrogenase